MCARTTRPLPALPSGVALRRVAPPPPVAAPPLASRALPLPSLPLPSRRALRAPRPAPLRPRSSFVTYVRPGASHPYICDERTRVGGMRRGDRPARRRAPPPSPPFVRRICAPRGPAPVHMRRTKRGGGASGDARAAGDARATADGARGADPGLTSATPRPAPVPALRSSHMYASGPRTCTYATNEAGWWGVRGWGVRGRRAATRPEGVARSDTPGGGGAQRHARTFSRTNELC